MLERRLDVVKAQNLFDQVAVRLGTSAKNSWVMLSLIDGLSVCSPFLLMVYQYVLQICWWFISMFPPFLMVCGYFPPSFDGLSWCLPKLVGGFRYIPLWHFTTHVVLLVGVYPVLVSPRFEHRWIGLCLTTMGVQSTTVLVLCAANNHGKLRDFFMIFPRVW